MNQASAAPRARDRLSVVVWGTGNMGQAAIRAVDAHPSLRLGAVVVADVRKDGRDAGDLAGLDHSLGVAATTDAVGVLDRRWDAIAYMASGDVRPDAALDDVLRCMHAASVVVTPALYGLYDPTEADPATRDAAEMTASRRASRLFVSGIDPGWANDALAVVAANLVATVRSVRCQEIFDYSTYDQPDAVRTLVGMGKPLDEIPPMVAPGVPTMVWGGQVRLIARGLGIEIDDVIERVERRALQRDVTNPLGWFEKGTQGALRFEVIGLSGGEPAVVVEHVTRIDAGCAADWPLPPAGSSGVHRVVVDGDPRLTISVEATDGSGNQAAGGNATAAQRLVGAIPWLVEMPPGLYDGLDVPLSTSRVGRGRGGSGRLSDDTMEGR